MSWLVAGVILKLAGALVLFGVAITVATVFIVGLIVEAITRGRK